MIFECTNRIKYINLFKWRNVKVTKWSLNHSHILVGILTIFTKQTLTKNWIGFVIAIVMTRKKIKPNFAVFSFVTKGFEISVQ